MNLAAILPIAFQWIGASRYTDWALKLLPYVTKYGPAVLAWLDNAKETWATFKTRFPKLSSAIEALAKKWFPALDLDWASEIALKAIFAPHKMTPEEEKIWMNRGTHFDPDLSDFPQQTT